MLTVKHLTKKYGERMILDDISLNVKKGQTVSIIGPSGAGKSTLLRCIDFLEIPQKAQITLDNLTFTIPGMSNKEMLAGRRKSTMVFQEYNLFKNMTVIQNIMEALVTVHKVNKSEAYERAERALTSVGMKGREKSYPDELSGGQQQRIGIARAAVVKPKLMLLDEPTSALDPESIGGILDLVGRLHEQEQTMVIVTHEMSFAKKVSDQVLVLENGKFIEQGEPNQIFDDPKNPRTKEFLSNFN